MVPDGALAYLEIPDPAGLAEQLSTTGAWKALAPTLGWPQRLAGLGSIRRLLPLADFGQENLEGLLTVPMALAVTGVEVERGDIRPHLAFLFQTSEATDDLERSMQSHLKALANRAYGNVTEQTLDYAGHKIHLFQSPDGSHRIAWSIVDRSALISNQMGSIQSMIDTGDHRRASLEANPKFQQSRATQPDSTPVFGYINTETLGKTLQQSSWSAESSSAPARMAGSALQILLSAFDVSLAYGLAVEDGAVVERYHWLSTTELSQELTPSPQERETITDSLQFIPQGTKSFTLLRLGDLDHLFERLDATLSRRLPAFSSIALRELIIRLKRTWGFDRQDTMADTIKGDIAVIEGDHPELLVVARAKRKAKLAALIGKYLGHDGGAARSVRYKAFDIFSSTDETRRAFCFLDDTLLIGPVDLIKWVIDARAQGQTLDRAPDTSTLIDQYGQGALEVSVRLDRQDAARRIATGFQGFSARPVDADQIKNLIRGLPPTIRTTRSSSQGLVSETRSPWGEFPLWLINQDTKDKELLKVK
jgi:hypothetical protein